MAPCEAGDLTPILQARKAARKLWGNGQGYLAGRWQNLALRPVGPPLHAWRTALRLGSPGWGWGWGREGSARDATPKEPPSSSRAVGMWGRPLRVCGKHPVRCFGHVGPRGLGKLRPL